MIELQQRQKRNRARPALVGRGEAGNRCGHNAARPRFDLLWEPKKNLPPFIYQAVDRIREVVYFQRWAFFEPNEMKRTERLEALVMVLCVLAYRTDLVSGRVGTPATANDDWFRGITAEYIHMWTGMRLGRVNRALDDIRAHGWVTSVQPCELDEQTGEYRGLAAVRNLTMKFWTRLRLKNQYDEARNAACVRKRLQHFQVHERRSKKVRRRRQAIAAKVSKLADSTRQQAEVDNRELLVAMAKLQQLHPEWGLRELRDEALKLL